jgi:hypothetical protein
LTRNSEKGWNTESLWRDAGKIFKVFWISAADFNQPTLADLMFTYHDGKTAPLFSGAVPDFTLAGHLPEPKKDT